MMNQKPKTIPSTELKQHLGDYLGKVVHGRQTFLIEKHGKSVAALIPIESLEKVPLKNENKTAWALDFERLIQDIADYNKDKNLGPSDAVEFLRQVREDEESRLL